MKRVSLPGGWVDFREPEDVPEKLRRRVVTKAAGAKGFSDRIGAMNAETVSMTEDDMGFMLSFNDAVAVCLIMGWSWEYPVSEDGLQELPASAYDAIVRHSQTMVSRLMPNFSVDPDPKALTEN